MIFWTTLLVLGLGGIGSLFMLEPPETIILAQQRANSLSIGRRPASSSSPVAEITSLDNQSRFKAVEFKLPCNSQTPSEQIEFKNGVSQLRLSSDCLSYGESTKIINTTNGFSATVFQLSATTFTTDYIPLTVGRNELIISQNDGSGSIRKNHYIFVRQKE